MKTTGENRPTWAEIDLDNLAFNFRSVKVFVDPSIEYMAVVKANAYGHGAVECARRLEAEGIDWLGVALPEEGIELREAGIRKRILCLGSFWRGQEKQLLNHDSTPVVYQLNQAKALDQAAKNRGSRAEIHVKIDTGMNRIGVRFDEIQKFLKGLRKLENVHVEGIMTHFAAADNLEETEFTNLQMKRFADVVKVFEQNGFRAIYNSLANSPGSIAHPNSRGNMVRLGGVLYGLSDDVLPKGIEIPLLKPVLSLHTRIANLKNLPAGETLGYGRTFTTAKDSLIATIPIGYQDGYSRNLSNRGRAIINGVYSPIVGTVSMDWTMIDVTEVPNIDIGDEVILIGENAGLEITAEELARKTETISYEITCGINERVTKNFCNS